MYLQAAIFKFVDSEKFGLGGTFGDLQSEFLLKAELPSELDHIAPGLFQSTFENLQKIPSSSVQCLLLVSNLIGNFLSYTRTSLVTTSDHLHSSEKNFTPPFLQPSSIMSPNRTGKSPLRSPFSKLNKPSVFCSFLYAMYSSPPITLLVLYWARANLLISLSGSTTGQRIPDAASLVQTKEKNDPPLLTGHFCQCSPESGKLSLLQSIADPGSTCSFLGALILFCRAVCYLAGQCLACTSFCPKGRTCICY